MAKKRGRSARKKRPAKPQGAAAAGARAAEARKAEANEAEPRTAEARQSEPRQSEPRKAAPRRAGASRADSNRSEGRRSEGTKTQRRDAQAPARRARVLDPLLLALAGAGIVLTIYLTLTAWFGEQPAFCSPGSGCDLVQQSRWSTFLGLPMALWGLATYALLARFLWRLRTRPSAWRPALWVALLGVAVSWYLTAISVLAIEATCAWCLVSFALMNALLVLLLVRRPAHLPAHRWGAALPAPAAFAVAAVLGLHLHFSGVFDPAAGPEDPYLAALATHLDEQGARFFGAYWCPHCEDQKALFGAAAPRLPYVECSPEGRNGPVALACLDNDVRDYPTWIVNGRRLTGVVRPSELARLSGFQPADPSGARR